MEYLRNFSDLRFNWMTLAYTQSYYLHFIQIIEYTGYLFLSFVLLFAAVSLYAAVGFRRKERWLLPGFTFFLILVLIVYGEYRMHQVHGMEYQVMKVGLVQPNVDPYEKWSPDYKNKAFRLLMSQSRELDEDEPDLVVWPETATPFYLKNYPDMLHEIASFTDSSQLYLLTGTPDYEYSPDYLAGYTYNAAFFFTPGSRKFEKYHKIALVPGSESVPFKTWVPFLRNLNGGGGDFYPGREFTVFNFRIPKRSGSFQSGTYSISSVSHSDSTQVGLSAVICYESVFPHLVHQFIQSGAAVLAVITNDGWFGNTSGPYQHARYAVFRAVENRVAVIRCANTGISDFIDPAGHVLEQLGLNKRGNLVAWIPLQTRKTYYTRNGEWFGRLMLIISGTFIFFVLLSNLFFRT
jgi:apolipoprotein N-acyltransferase